jgi:hypothetical protein
LVKPVTEPNWHRSLLPDPVGYRVLVG